MILPNFKIVSLSNADLKFSGMDSIEQCKDTSYFTDYPYEISYKYNSRGFRDEEWPNNLEDCIWCFGDSYTVGIGQSYKNTWPKLLETKTGIRTISLSMDGASNEWISRKILELVETIKPKAIVVQWSFIHRRERELLPGEIDLDENRIVWYNKDSTDEDDIQNTLDCIMSTESVCANAGIKLIHSVIPGFMKDQGSGEFLSNLIKLVKNCVPLFRLDYARDGLHYDVKTSKVFVEKLIKVI